MAVTASLVKTANISHFGVTFLTILTVENKLSQTHSLISDMVELAMWLLSATTLGRLRLHLKKLCPRFRGALADWTVCLYPPAGRPCFEARVEAALQTPDRVRPPCET